MVDIKEELLELHDGINPPCSNERYHANRTHLSSSVVKLLSYPIHHKYRKDYYDVYVLGKDREFKTTPSMTLGSYVHSRILEPEITDSEFAIMPEKGSNGKGFTRRSADWDAFAAKNIDKTIISYTQFKRANEMISLYEQRNVLINGDEVPLTTFFTEGYAEDTVCAEIDGVKFKVRTDYRKEFGGFGSINDVKTCADGVLSKDNIEDIIARWSYDISAALYVDVMEIALGFKHDFYFLFMSTTSGAIRLVKASEQLLEQGRKKYKKGIKNLLQARTSGIYYIEKSKEELTEEERLQKEKLKSIAEINTPKYDLFVEED